MSIAMVLPAEGRVVACDVSQEYADVGMPLWKEVGMTPKIASEICPWDHQINNSLQSAGLLFHSPLGVPNTQVSLCMYVMVYRCFG